MDNYLLLGIGIFTLVCVLVGIMRGFIKIAISLAATLIVLVIVIAVTPKVSDALMNHTPVGDMVTSQLGNMVSGRTDYSSYSNDTIRAALNSLGKEQLSALGISDVDNLSDADIEAAKAKLQEQGISLEEAAKKAGVNVSGEENKAEGDSTPELSLQDQISLIEGTDMPSFLKTGLLDNNNKEIYSQLGVNNFVDYVKQYAAKWIVNVVAFLLTFVVAFVIVRIVIFSLDALSELPVLHGVNRVAGGMMGLGFALLFVWIAFMVITLLYTTDLGKQCFAFIGDSKALTFLYNNNIILKVLS